MNMTVAIFGLGEAARNIHIPACNSVSGLEIAGAVDPEIITSQYAFPVFRDSESLFREVKPDIAVIAAPTSCHHPLCLEMLHRGCHVICEKPFTETLEQAFEVVETAEHLGLSVIVNNEFRYMQCHLAAKERIGKPEFGELQYIEMGQTFYTTDETEKGWRGDDPQRTCKEFGIHAFDLCRFFYGEDPLTINARMPRPGLKSGPDYLNLIDLEFTDDRYARITLDRLSRGRHRYLDIRLDGTHACIETSLGGNLYFEVGVKPKTRRPYAAFDLSWGGAACLWEAETSHKIASDPRNLFANATANLLKDWLRSLEQETEPATSGRNNIGTLALMLAAYESARQKLPVDMSKFRKDAYSSFTERDRTTFR